MAWSDNPELAASFRHEAAERSASLRDGLLALEGSAQPRQAATALMRDAHTLKGSATMFGAAEVVELAHRAEDLLARVRDGRVAVRRDVIDLLLLATELLSRWRPGEEWAVPADVRADTLVSLDAAISGRESVEVPRLPAEPSPVAAEAPDAAAEELPSAHAGGRLGDQVRVPTRRVHGLLDVVGEAELDVRRVERHTRELSDLLSEHQVLVKQLRAALLAGGSVGELGDRVTAMVGVGDRLHATTRDLRSRTEDAGNRLARVRDGAMGLAMVPVRRVAAAFPALVREVAGASGKDVELVLDGADVELDVRVLDGVADALRHLVTNAVDHGCETPDGRAAAGKPRRAIVTLAARTAGSSAVVEVADDGAGVDDDLLREIAVRRGYLPEGTTASGSVLHQVLFEPGFSTREDVTTTSGRGVGLDVVRSAVQELGGTIEVVSTLGLGTRFILTLPVTLGVARCLLVRCGTERYAVPLAGVVETLSLGDVAVHDVAGSLVISREDSGATMPLADLGEVLGVVGARSPRAVVVARLTGESVAWAVDEVESEREVVVKSLGDFLGRVPGAAGATIDDDGSVLLLVDLRELALRWTGSASLGAGVPEPLATETSGAAPRERDTAEGQGRARVLVVEDSLGVRELQRSILEGAGYDVVTAVDGLDGAARLQGGPVDLVLSDVEMPGMDGFTLTRTIRKTRGWENVPVVIMTSRGDDADKRAGLDAGADAYLLKREFDQRALVDTVRRLVGR
ncbi:hybrid sensor histidine kinase/response regulator [Longivirga aurantiaca]|uniref:histidine kinase n=1 Tax=Longivirga aurantiaca TaxID=1837743 RepID=A0ABW1SZR9_9ACTN